MDLRVLPGDEDRKWLAPLRAQEWRGELTADQYGLRNEHLYAHPFGRQRMRTYTLRDATDRIVTSLDLLGLSLLVGTEGQPQELPGVLVANVFTAPADRGKGYASRLLSWYFEKHPGRCGVLYSDIGPEFYEKFGFSFRPATMVEIAASAEGKVPSETEALSLSEFVLALQQLRRQNLAASGRAAGAVLPDALMWDWQLERYRFFAELAKAPFPERLFWRLNHRGFWQETPHLLASVPDFLTGRVDLFWKYPGCRECEMAAGALASQWGLKAIRFWETDPTRAGKREVPMIRIPDLPAPVFFSDPQLGDYW